MRLCPEWHRSSPEEPSIASRRLCICYGEPSHKKAKASVLGVQICIQNPNTSCPTLLNTLLSGFYYTYGLASTTRRFSCHLAAYGSMASGPSDLFLVACSQRSIALDPSHPALPNTLNQGMRLTGLLEALGRRRSRHGREILFRDTSANSRSCHGGFDNHGIHQVLSESVKDGAESCRNLIKKALALYGFLNRDPIIWGIQNQEFLNQVPTLLGNSEANLSCKWLSCKRFETSPKQQMRENDHIQPRLMVFNNSHAFANSGRATMLATTRTSGTMLPAMDRKVGSGGWT